jgi:rod shape-determining protein MreC
MYKWLAEFFGLAKNYIIFALLISLSLLLISTNNNGHTRGLQVVGLVTTSYLEAGVNDVLGYFSLSSEVKKLQLENAHLIDQNAKIRGAMEENRQLRGLLNLRQQSSYPLIPGDVVGRSADGGRNFITLDIGEKNGVSVNDHVVSGTGLVGIVSAVSENFLLVRTLLDVDSRVAAKLVNASADGLVVSGSYGELAMENVSRRYPVQPGDIVETSSLSTLVPPGIAIGMVTKAENRPGDIFKKIDVEPAVDYTSITTAFVMKYSRPAEATKLEKEHLQKEK